jgi:hypothetical protein
MPEYRYVHCEGGTTPCTGPQLRNEETPGEFDDSIPMFGVRRRESVEVPTFQYSRNEPGSRSDTSREP